jgi:opacity protein-like surface antigen
VNRVRFSFSERYTNSAFDARPYSITGNEFPKVSNYDERIGANMGGPLKIPHIYDGTNKTFFFANFQHDTQKSGINTFSTVPTLAERSGNFCGLGVTLYNPFSNLAGPRTPLGNGCQIPSIDPASQALLQYFPLPNVPGQTAQNFLLQATTPHNTDSFNIHVLHTINAKLNLNIGYNFSSSRQDTITAFPDIRGRQTSRSQNVDLGLIHNWSPRLTENTHLNWSRSRNQTLSANSFVNNIAGNLCPPPSPSCNITGIATDPIDYGLPGIQFSSFTGFNDPVPSRVRNQTLRLSDALTWVKTKHTLTFGGEVRRIELNADSNPNPRGAFRFTGVMTNQLNANGDPATPLTPVTEPYYEFADFLLGLPYNTAVQFGDPNTYFRAWGFIGYAQDDFRVNKRFTFQYGVRYQAQTPPIELYNHIANLDLNSTATAVAVVTPGETGPFSGAYPRALIRGDYNDWAPRIGFAWDPGLKKRTIVRSGYSIFYNQSIYNSLAQKYLAYQPPFDQSQNLYTSAAQVLTLQQGFPAQTAANKILNTAGVNPNYRPAYAQIWMLGTETSFTQNWLLDLTYTGTKGTSLDLLRAPNRAPLGTGQLNTQTDLQIPYATSFYYDQSGANSIYNALQVRVVHRYTHGVSFQGAYTFSKSIDNASSIGGTGGIVVQQDGNYAAERGLSSFDMRHQFRFSSTYELPFGERNRWANHGWKEHALGNLRLLNTVTWHTGTPLTVYLGGSAANNSGTGSNFSERANLVGNPNLGICGGGTLNFFNTAAFATPPAGEYGDEHRGSVEGPCQFNWNLSIAKSVRFGREQRHTFNASWEIQNLTNTPSFNGVGSTLGSSTFGRVTGAGSMRTMDIMIRFNL